jgi:hypothetical protein
LAELVHTGEAPRLPSLLSRLETRPALNAFLVVFVGTLIVALIQGPKPFYGDSGGYWQLASTFTHNGHFSLLNFESETRGYVLPLAIYVLRAFAEGVRWTESSVAKLFNVVLFALIGAVLAPRLAEIMWPHQRWGLLRRVVLTTLLIVFWSGDLSYPLSDFPGLALALLTLIAVARPDTPGWMLLAGVGAGLTIDVRAAYLPFVLMLIAIIALGWFDQRRVKHASVRRRALCIGLLVIGFAAVSLPQSLSSHRHYGTWTFIPGKPSDLAQEHFEFGMYSQRYDTIVTQGEAYPGLYPDITGLRLLREQPNSEIKSLGEYSGVVFAHPLAMTELVARHIVNGLDMRYSTVYVEHLASGGHLWLRLPGFLLVFLALVRVLWPAARRSLGVIRWRYLVALLLCCLTSVFTAVETRYMLPVWLLGAMLVLAPAWPSPIDPGKVGLRRFRTPAILVVAYLAFMAVVWHVVSAATVHIVFS